MKKTIYYASLIVVWIVGLLTLSTLCLAIGLFPVRFGFGYSLGGACGHPQLWIISLGIVLLFRPIVWRFIAKESKDFKKSTAFVILIVGIVWLSMNIGTRMLRERAIETLLEHYEP